MVHWMRFGAMECRSERIAKYNRLLVIEAKLGKRAVFGGGVVFGKGK